jgi:cell division protease FtsH
MTLATLIISVVAFLALTGLCAFNGRFCSRLFGTVWRLRYPAIILIALYFLMPMVLGASTANSIISMLPTMILQIVMALAFVVVQFGLMFYMMGNMNRPEVYLPGDSLNLDWSDWIGSEDVKRELQKAVASLKNWELYARYGTKPLNGMLLYGPPGTGKSLAAKVVASQAGMPVVIASSSSLNGPFMGMGMMLVRSLGRKVRKLSKKYGGAVVFLDEIDAIGASRGGLQGQGGGGFMPGMGFMGGGMGGNGTLQTLLTVMSGAENGETFSLKMRKRWGLAKKTHKHTWRILWMAATNIQLDMLDPALTRSGRFGSLRLPINPPNDENRKDLFRLYLRKKHVAEDLEFDQLVQLSRGMTGADIEEVCEAAMRTIIFTEGERAMTDEDLFIQIRMKKNGVPRSVPLHEKERWPIAVHEAGHGIGIVHYPPVGMLCSGATLRPTEDFLGAVMFEKVEELSMMMEEDCYRRVLIAVASRAAEEIILKDRSAGVGSDLNQAMGMALAMVEVYGMGERLTSAQAVGNGHIPDAIKQAEDMLEATLRVAKRMIAANAGAVDALAHALCEKIDLTGRQVIDIVKTNGEAPFESVADAVKAELETVRKERKEADKPASTRSRATRTGTAAQ